jgi:hypothetical protein
MRSPESRREARIRAPTADNAHRMSGKGATQHGTGTGVKTGRPAVE